MNDRQATTVHNPTTSRGTEWQDQLFRLVKEAAR